MVRPSLFANAAPQELRAPQEAATKSWTDLVHETLRKLCPGATDEVLIRAWDRLVHAAVRGGAAGLTVRGGLHLFSTLLWLLRTSKPSRAPGTKPPKRGMSTLDALQDMLRFSLFLATLGGTYVAVDEGLAISLGKERTAKWRALVAGAVAGHTLLLTGSRARHHSLATYVLLRGLTLLVRCGNKQPPAGQQSSRAAQVLRALLAPTRLQHGDVLLMCAASAQIVYSYIMMPDTLPASYIRFVGKQAAKQPYVWKAVREQALRNWKGHPPGPLPHLHGTPWQSCVGHTPCEFWHPGQSCTAHAASILPQSYLRSLGVYIPVYLVPALLVHRHKLLHTPLPILPKLAFGIARSSLFLTSFIALAFGGACLGFNLWGTSTGPIIGVFTAAGGLATLVEKKSRRMELALYCSSRALESFARCLQQWGLVPRSLLPARLDVLLFSAGCAAIMHCYSDDCGQHRDVFRSKYLNVLDLIFGNSGVTEGAITHLPSNRDLFTSVGRRLRSLSSMRLDSAGAPVSADGKSPPSKASSRFTRDRSASHAALTSHAAAAVDSATTYNRRSHGPALGLHATSHHQHNNNNNNNTNGSRPLQLHPMPVPLTSAQNGNEGRVHHRPSLTPSSSVPAFQSMHESLIASSSQQHQQHHRLVEEGPYNSSYTQMSTASGSSTSLSHYTTPSSPTRATTQDVAGPAPPLTAHTPPSRSPQQPVPRHDSPPTWRAAAHTNGNGNGSPWAASSYPQSPEQANAYQHASMSAYPQAGGWVSSLRATQHSPGSPWHLLGGAPLLSAPAGLLAEIPRSGATAPESNMASAASSPLPALNQLPNSNGVGSDSSDSDDGTPTLMMTSAGTEKVWSVRWGRSTTQGPQGLGRVSESREAGEQQQGSGQAGAGVLSAETGDTSMRGGLRRGGQMMRKIATAPCFAALEQQWAAHALATEQRVHGGSTSGSAPLEGDNSGTIGDARVHHRSATGPVPPPPSSPPSREAAPQDQAVHGSSRCMAQFTSNNNQGGQGSNTRGDERARSHPEPVPARPAARPAPYPSSSPPKGSDGYGLGVAGHRMGSWERQPAPLSPLRRTSGASGSASIMPSSPPLHPIPRRPSNGYLSGVPAPLPPRSPRSLSPARALGPTGLPTTLPLLTPTTSHRAAMPATHSHPVCISQGPAGQQPAYAPAFTSTLGRSNTKLHFTADPSAPPAHINVVKTASLGSMAALQGNEGSQGKANGTAAGTVSATTTRGSLMTSALMAGLPSTLLPSDLPSPAQMEAMMEAAYGNIATGAANMGASGDLDRMASGGDMSFHAWGAEACQLLGAMQQLQQQEQERQDAADGEAGVAADDAAEGAQLRGGQEEVQSMMTEDIMLQGGAGVPLVTGEQQEDGVGVLPAGDMGGAGAVGGDEVEPASSSGAVAGGRAGEPSSSSAPGVSAPAATKAPSPPAAQGNKKKGKAKRKGRH